jgi:hemerythrin-like metal-binding protein
MNKTIWKSEFSVASKYLDKQHQTLFMIVNDFNDSISKGQGIKTAYSILNRLTLYAEEHFRDEEHLMNAARFPKDQFEAHVREHEKLTEKIFTICADLSSNGEEVLPGINQFLKEWLVDHILTTDKKYSKYVANIDDTFMNVK